MGTDTKFYPISHYRILRNSPPKKKSYYTGTSHDIFDIVSSFASKSENSGYTAFI